MVDNYYEPIGAGPNSVVPAPPPAKVPVKIVPLVPPLVPSRGANKKSQSEKSMEDELTQSNKVKSKLGTVTNRARGRTDRSVCARISMIISVVCFIFNTLIGVGFGLLYFNVIKTGGQK